MFGEMFTREWLKYCSGGPTGIAIHRAQYAASVT